ncbi:dihydrofolate reductase family protein [Streptomyces sp. NPDC004609]|uniref:dihydrofolate reductase family protein n=1 Tax=Streptomyces sp. NPDC004609 TaxID=3364704 RepID=UPI0036C33A33
MSKVVALVHTSMDGVMARPAWTTPIRNDEHAKYRHGQLLSSRALLLGRHTYDGLSKAWPTMEDGEIMNSIPKYVASTTLRHAEWNASVIKGDVAEEVAKLKGEPGQDLLVYGSGTLVTYLIRHDLVDELKLFVQPVVVGSGKRLFPDGVDTTTWTLAGIAAFSTGTVVLDYRPAGTAA